MAIKEKSISVTYKCDFCNVEITTEGANPFKRMEVYVAPSLANPSGKHTFDISDDCLLLTNLAPLVALADL